MTNGPATANAPPASLALRDARDHLRRAAAAISAAIDINPTAANVRLGLQAKALLQAVSREADAT